MQRLCALGRLSRHTRCRVGGSRIGLRALSSTASGVSDAQLALARAWAAGVAARHTAGGGDAGSGAPWRHDVRDTLVPGPVVRLLSTLQPAAGHHNPSNRFLLPHDPNGLPRSPTAHLTQTADPTLPGAPAAAAGSSAVTPTLSEAEVLLLQLQQFTAQPSDYRMRRDHPPVNVVAPLAHWLYGLPAQPEYALNGADGYAADDEPPHPFHHRMWAGGSVEWLSDLKWFTPIRVRSRTRSAVCKATRHGPMLFVTVEKRVDTCASPNDPHGTDSPAIRELQMYAYRAQPALTASADPSTAAAASASDAPADALPLRDSTDVSGASVHRRVAHPTDITLLRYSALTFNAHRIHWDAHYSRTVEGYAAPLVHGPLSATYLLQHVLHAANAARIHAAYGPYARPPLHGWTRIKRFDYKARSPTLVGTDLALEFQRVAAASAASAPSSNDNNGEQQFAVRARNAATGAVTMDGTVVLA